MASIVIALVFSWSLTLVILGLVPLLAVTQGVHTKVKAGATGNVKRGYEESSNVSFIVVKLLSCNRNQQTHNTACISYAVIIALNLLYTHHKTDCL